MANTESKKMHFRKQESGAGFTPSLQFRPPQSVPSETDEHDVLESNVSPPALSGRRKNPPKLSAGFTLMELLIGIGILMIIFAIGAIFTLSGYQRYLVREERDTAVAALMKARSRAMTNYFQSPQGVHIAPSNFTLFRGSNFSTSDPSTHEIIPANSYIEKTGTIDVVFRQLRGNVQSPPAAVILTNGASTITISINDEGRIDW